MQAPALPGQTSPGSDVSAPGVRRGDDAGARSDGSSEGQQSTRGLAVLSHLRTSTAPAHEQVEARLFPSALQDLASYRRMLAVLLALHEPLEQHFATRCSDGFGALAIDLTERRKADRLRDDLVRLDALLGVPAPRPAGLHAVPSVSPTPIASLPMALGAFYVLEGSTLGGRFLLPEVRERLGEVPVAFLTGYGTRTGRLWKQTRTALVRGVTEAPHPPTAEEELVAGADATFSRLDALLDQAGWAARVTA